MKPLSFEAVEGTKIYPAPTRAWLDIDTAAMRRNAEALASRSGRALIPMVKADAYGVGLAAAVAALEPTNPWGYGVATVAEGKALRDMGIRRHVVLFTPILPSEFQAAQAARLTPSLCSAAAILEWGLSGHPYHLSVDTGMNRAGICWRDIESLSAAAREFPPAGAYTHFHSAEMDDGSAAVQEDRFRKALLTLGVPIPFLHVASSSAVTRCGVTAWDAIRPGIFLYGVGSGPGAGVAPEPVVSFRARIVELRWIEPGDTVSYDATYVAHRRERIATVAAGYGDGYPRSLSTRGVALLNGALIPVRGLVTMDMTMFDVTDAPCEVGDCVTLVGSEGGPALTVEDVAGAAQMSPYELLTGLAHRLDRCYPEKDTPL